MAISLIITDGVVVVVVDVADVVIVGGVASWSISNTPTVRPFAYINRVVLREVSE